MKNIDLEKIFSYVENLEKRLQILESKEAVIITNALKAKQVKPLDLTVEKLIDIYNDVPQILTEYAVEVSLTAESYRKKTNKQIILEKVVNGNYWVILLEENLNKNYYLLPNAEKKLKIHRMDSINYLFELQQNKNLTNDNFYLTQPALISIYPSGNEWLLEKKGLLSLTKNISVSKLESPLTSINPNSEKINSNMPELSNLLESQELQLQELQSEIASLKNRITQLEPKYQKLTILYNENPEKFDLETKDSEKVTLSQKTITNIYTGNLNFVDLEINPNGEYLIKKSASNSAYLFPNPQYLFDKMTLNFAYQTKLFVFHNIPLAIMGKDIKLKKPAKVKQIDQIWRVIDNGEIDL